MKIAILLSRFPYPLEKGDKLRAFHQIKHLSKDNEIHLFCIINQKPKKEDLGALLPYTTSIKCAKLSLFSRLISLILYFLKGKPLQAAYFYGRGVQKKWDDYLAETQPDLVYCQLLRMADYIQSRSYPNYLDFQDAFSLGIERRIQVSSFFKSLILSYEFRALKKMEAACLEKFDGSSIISEQDSLFLSQGVNKKITLISNGVDAQFFKKSESADTLQYDILFTGNMSYPPNIDAAIYLMEEILPLLRSVLGQQITCLIAGTNPGRVLRKLARENRVVLSGWLPDIRQAYQSAKVFVAPMRLGSGQQNKLLEAMASELPCVTTDLASAPILKLGQNLDFADQGILRVAQNPQDFVDKIAPLLNDEKLRLEEARASRAYILKYYTWEEQVEKLEASFKEICSKK